jgi:hypothetical protein
MGRMFESEPGSRSVFTNTAALESAANRLNRCRLNQMHGARKRRSAVHLSTGGFHSRNCIRVLAEGRLVQPHTPLLTPKRLESFLAKRLGFYSVTQLPPGVYSVRIDAQAFNSTCTYRAGRRQRARQSAKSFCCSARDWNFFTATVTTASS